MTPLKIILGSDLLPWERELFSGLIDGMRRHFHVDQTDFLERPRRGMEPNHPLWIITRGWKEAARKSRVWPAHHQVLITVLDSTQAQPSWQTLLFEKWETPPPNQQFLCLTPITYRFLSELKGVEKKQLHFIPLPIPNSNREARLAGNQILRPKLRVGTFSKFTSENNLHHVITTAHYVTQRNPSIEFTLMGYGPLTRHLRNTINSLNLESTVTIKETTNVSDIQALDLFLYLPIRNDHFGPLLYAGHFGLPVIANELPGIEDFILEGRTGFIVPPHDTRTLGELILRMDASQELKQGLSQGLRAHLTAQFSASQTAERIARLFGAEPKSVSLAS